MVELTVATPVALELHVPPVVALVKEICLPGQTDVLPEIAEGVGLTVTEPVATQPLLVAVSV